MKIFSPLGGVCWSYSHIARIILPPICGIYPPVYSFDGFLLATSKAGVGSYIGGIFVGAFANYADDIAIVALSATALRRLLTINVKNLPV
jgi:hypothetical protein